MSTSSVRSSRTVRRVCSAPSSTASRAGEPSGSSSAAAASPYETPARFCTPPPWRSCAIRRRSCSDPAIARLRRAPPPRRPALRQRLGRRGEPVRDAGEVLHHAVVEVLRDPPPLVLGRVDRAPQQRLALALAELEAPRE